MGEFSIIDALIALGMLANLLVARLTKKQLQPRRRKKGRDNDDAPRTLGEAVSAVQSDVESIKVQQGEQWRAVANHIADSSIHVKDGSAARG